MTLFSRAISNTENFEGETSEKMLKSQPEDALVKFVKLVKLYRLWRL